MKNDKKIEEKHCEENKSEEKHCEENKCEEKKCEENKCEEKKCVENNCEDQKRNLNLPSLPAFCNFNDECGKKNLLTLATLGVAVYFIAK